MHNSTLLTTNGHPPPPNSPQPNSPQPAQPALRVGFVDRAALRVGVALVAWSRRPRAVESREQQASRVEQELAILAREERWAKLRLMRF